MLHTLLKKMLKRMERTAYYARGEVYFNEGRVARLDGDDEEITARVRGSYGYSVRLWEENGELLYDCTCPVGEDGEFCKHCVAVGLAWFAENGTKTGKQTGPRKKRRNAMDEIRDYLATLEPAAMLELALDACKRDARMRERLLLKAAERGDFNAAIRTWKASLDRATAIRDFVDWREMPSFAAGINEALDVLDGWLADGRAEPVVEMAEYAAAAVEGVIGGCDDSNGELGEILHRIGELHLAACKGARPDPEALAGRLFNYEMTGEWDTFADASTRYSTVLGKRGLAAYRRLAEAQWAKVPPLQAGADKGQSWRGDRDRITRVMETLARQSGDVDAMAAVMSRDLSSEWGFLRIAQVYREANQRDLALKWAERGLAAFPRNTDARLRDFLIEEYLRRRRGGEALALVWAQFEDRPHLET
jgi:tetratricopeptide (TPR) repeat protein